MSQFRISDEDLAEADELDWTQENEFWNSYRLSDGTLLKVKLVLKAVKRLKMYNPDGTPMYVIGSEQIMRATEVQENVKKKSK